MSIRWARVMISLAVVALAIAGSVFNTDAHHAVLRFNLEEMTVASDRIFVGRCIGVEETEEEIAQGRMPVTLYRFEVERAVKGQLPKQLTFRQLGHPARRALGKGGEISMHGRKVTPRAFFHGMSEYEVGDRLVLFLIPDYLGGKVTYPVGLYQGAFDVSEMPSGEQLVRNNINNLGLFTSPYNGTRMRNADAKIIFPGRGAVASPDEQGQSLARKRGALPLGEFVGMVEQINVSHGGERGSVTESQRGAIQQQ
jgi:hypothetical protein